MEPNQALPLTSLAAMYILFHLLLWLGKGAGLDSRCIISLDPSHFSRISAHLSLHSCSPAIQGVFTHFHLLAAISDEPAAVILSIPLHLYLILLSLQAFGIHFP